MRMHTHANYTNLNTHLINQTQNMQLKYPVVWLGVKGHSSDCRMSHLSIIIMKSRIIYSPGHESAKKLKNKMDLDRKGRNQTQILPESPLLQHHYCK